MYSKEEKQKKINEIKTIISSNDCFYVANLGNITVENDMALRTICREKGIGVKVVKNSLLSIAIKDIGLISDSDISKINKEYLKGISTIFFIDKTYNAPGRILNDFKKKKSVNFSLKFALADKTVYFGEKGLKTLTSMKSLEEMLSDVVLAIQSVGSNLVDVIRSCSDNIIGVLKSIVDKSK